MRLDLVPDGLLERLALRLGLVPAPWLRSQSAVILARAGMAACRLGIFETLSGRALTAAEVAGEAKLHPTAVKALLEALVATGDLIRHGKDGYANAPRTEKWLLPTAPQSLHHNMLWRYAEWDALSDLEEHLRSGRPAGAHDRKEGPEKWRAYLRGMADLAGLLAEEVAHRVPLPPRPVSLVDIGGGHGRIADAFCRRHPDLKAVVYDLPEAVAEARSLASELGLSERVTFESRDALTDDFGTGRDAALLFNILHHFTPEQVRDVLRRVAGCLRPGGVAAVCEPFRVPANPKEQLGALFNLLFSLLSGAEMPTIEELESGLDEAGLHPSAPLALRTAPGVRVLVARKVERKDS
jgi:SAM-dependent methyltransferase